MRMWSRGEEIAMSRWFSLDEEGRRSRARRGLVGHYTAGIYRTVARPIATWQLIQRAKFLNFIWGMEEVANLVSHLPQRYINPVLRTFGATIAEDAIITELLRLTSVNQAGFQPLKVGKNAFFGSRILIDLADEVTFGDCCTIGHDSRFFCHIDVAHSPLKANLFPVDIRPIRIGRGVFIGSGTTVTQGVTIGECSIIGVNAAVVSDIPPHCFAAGVPAKVIRKLDKNMIPPFNPDEACIIPEGTTP